MFSFAGVEMPNVTHAPQFLMDNEAIAIAQIAAHMLSLTPVPKKGRRRRKLERKIARQAIRLFLAARYEAVEHNKLVADWHQKRMERDNPETNDEPVLNAELGPTIVVNAPQRERH